MVSRNLQREFDVLYPAFAAALAETIAWCSRPSRPTAPDQALRSPELQEVAAPRAVREETPFGHVWRGVWPVADRPTLEQTISRVRRATVARRQLVVEQRLTEPASDGALHGGRLLAFDPALSMGSMASAEESRGFFDEYDGVGWDSWVMAFDTRAGLGRRGGGDLLVLAWVPSDLQRIAAGGVLVNEIECAWWPPRSADAKACLMSVVAGTAG